MKKFLVFCFLGVIWPSVFFAAGGVGVSLDSANINLDDKASLQRGVKYFVNYCLACHALSYNRYSRVAEDLGLSEGQMLENLIFTSEENGEPTNVEAVMSSTMPERYANQVFGILPPDLSVISRVRGADWLFTYLNGFYVDTARPLGVNNTVFKDVNMPHVLWELQGWQQPIYRYDVDSQGHTLAHFASRSEADVYVRDHTDEKHSLEVKKNIDHLELKEPGSMSVVEYRRITRDIVNFLQYAGEPAQLLRYKIGGYVLLYLFLLLILSYMLKREFWQDVH